MINRLLTSSSNFTLTSLCEVVTRLLLGAEAVAEHGGRHQGEDSKECQEEAETPEPGRIALG